MKKRCAAGLEITVVLAVNGIVAWVLASQLATTQTRWIAIPLFAAALVYLIYVSPVRWFQDALPSRGLGSRLTAFVRTDNFSRAGRAYGAVAGFGCLTILCASAWFRPEALRQFEWQHFLLKLAFYLPSAVVQQLVAVGWLFVRLQTLFDDAAWTASRRQWSVCLTGALLVSLFHLPNAPVMAATLLGGFAFFWIAHRSPNVFWAAVAHALLGTFLYAVAGLSLRMGTFYERPDLHFVRGWFPAIRKLLDPLR